jgi:large subunit ribosomal protein L4
MKATLYNQKGEKKGEVTLSKNLFEVEAPEGLIHEYLIYQQANARMPIAHVKNRSDVSGGGRKPFRQKGTGRARQGSTRNVHMRGGGVAFGPKKWQNFSKMMPKKMRKKALLAILSNKAKESKVIALDKFEAETPKTKEFVAMIAKMPVERNVLVVVDRGETDLRTASRNYAKSKTITSGYLNPADLLKYDNVLLTETALKNLEETYK